MKFLQSVKACTRFKHTTENDIRQELDIQMVTERKLCVIAFVEEY